MASLVSIALITERLAQGEKLGDGDVALLKDALIELERPETWMAKTLGATVGSASLAAEFALTAGWGTAGRKAAVKGIEKLAAAGLDRLATKEGREAVSKLLATRMAGLAADVATRTAMGASTQVAAEALERSIMSAAPEVLMGPDGKYYAMMMAAQDHRSFGQMLPKAFASVALSNLAERTGRFAEFPGASQALREMTEPMRESLMRQAMFQAFANKLGGKRAMELLSKAGDDLAKVQIHDLKGEMFEDIVDRAAQSLFLGEKFELPSFDDVTTMMASMALTRGAMATAQGVMGGRGERSDEVNAGAGVEASTTAPVMTMSGATHNPVTGAANAADADIWKPVTGGGIYEVQEEGSTQEQPRVAFSRGEELERGRQMVKQIQEIAQPGAFRRGPASQAKDFAGIVRDYQLTPDEATVTQMDYPYNADAHTTYEFKHKEGGEALIHVGKDGTVWVQSPDMRAKKDGTASTHQSKESEDNASDYIQGGDLLYQAAMTFAYNNGLKFMPDASVSRIAKLRRNSHMLSSALRHGTTRHLWPFSERAAANDAVATQWKEGDSKEAFEHNLALLAQQEVENVKRVLYEKGQETTDLRYDANSDTIEKRTRNPDGTLSSWQRLSEGDLESLVEGLDPGHSGVGKTTLSRALVIQSALDGQNVVQRAAGDYQSEKSLRGGVAPSSPGDTIQRVLGSREDPKSIFYSRGESSGSERVQRTGVTQAETAAAEARLKSTAQGRAIYGNVLIVDNRAALGGLQGRPGQQRYHAEDWDIMLDAEGFHDPRDGTVVIFRENVRVLEGETAAQAMARVVVHERVGHHGFDALRNSDSKFAKIWSQLARSIPKKDMEDLERRYTNLNGNREALALEWFAHQVGNMGGRAHLEPGSVAQQMWQAMRDWVVRQFPGHWRAGGANGVHQG